MEGTLSNRPSPLHTLVRHPYLVLAFCCLLVHAVSCVTGADPLSPEVLLLAACLSAGGLLLYGGSRALPGRRASLAAALCGVAGIAVWTALYARSAFPVRYLLTGGFLALLAAALWMTYTRRLTASRVLLLMMAAGFLLRAAYILYTTVLTRQHDMGTFDNIYGHAGYIRYLYDNGHLPDFDPLSRSQHYQPPLHHALCALWMRLNTAFLGLSLNQAAESLQVLTLFYSSACMLVGYRVLRELGLKGLALLVPMAILCFHPTLILMAGSINNDILSALLMMAAALWTLRWYRAPSFGRILCIALCIGLAMMTKLSGALVAPAVAVVFLIKLIQSRKAPSRLIGQYAAFGAAVFPLGLWWGVRNLLRFGTPITYVPMIADTDVQYIGHIPVLQRLFDFSPHQFSSIFMAWGNRNADYFEYNPTIGLLKTSLFGEFDFTSASPLMQPAAIFLFIVHLLLILLVIAAFFRVLFSRRSGLEPALKIFWAVFALVLLGSYYQFCLSYAHTCTQNIRYAVPILLVGAVFLGLALRQGEGGGSGRRFLRVITVILTGAFCLGSAAVYTLLAV